MTGAHCSTQHPRHRGDESAAIDADSRQGNESVLRTNVQREDRPQRQSSPALAAPTNQGRNVASMPTEHRHNPPCPECGVEAARITERELGRTEYEVTCSCVNGHLWITRWFAVRSA